MKQNQQIESRNSVEKKLERPELEYQGNFETVWKKMREVNDPLFEKKKKQLTFFNTASAYSLLAVVFLLAGFMNYRAFFVARAAVTVAIGKTIVNGRPLSLSQEISAGSRIQTEKDAASELKLTKKTVCRVLPDTDLTLQTLDDNPLSQKIQLILEKGSVTIQTGKLLKNESLQVCTKDFIVSVRGTSFLVGVDVSGNTRVAVEEGTVWIDPQNGKGETLILKAGYSVSLETNSFNKPQRPLNPISNDDSLKISGSLNKVLEQLGTFVTNVSTSPIQRIIGSLKSDQYKALATLVRTGTQYVLNLENNICFYREDGSEITRYNSGSAENPFTPCLASKDKIIAGCEQGGLYAFSYNGKLVWLNKQAGKSKYNAFPVITSYGILHPSLDKGLQVFTEDGALTSTITTPGNESIFAAPLFLPHTGMVIYGTDNAALYGYSLKENKLIWSLKDLSDRIVYPVIGDSRCAVVLFRATGKIVGYDPATGSELWSETHPELAKSSFKPYFKNGQCVFTDSQGTTAVILDSSTGKVLKRIEPKGTISAFLEDPNGLSAVLTDGTTLSILP